MRKALIHDSDGLVKNIIKLPDDWTGVGDEWPVPVNHSVVDALEGVPGDTWNGSSFDAPPPPPPPPEPTWEEKRIAAYGTWGEQLDQQYWDGVNGTTVWPDHIAKVKADHPKP
jgi:hypothetical protein